jgi:hypothetical protein
MPVTPDPDQSEVDTISTAAIQQARAEYSSRVRSIAKNWADGLKALLGISGFTALAVAPVAANTLSGPTRVLIGAVLGAMFLAGTLGLLLVLASASGTTRRYGTPATHAELILLQRNVADRAVRNLRLGRGLAVVTLVLIAGAIVTAWSDPWKGPRALLRATTANGSQYCGAPVRGPDGVLTVQSSDGFKEYVGLAEVKRLEAVDDCSRSS